MIGFLITRDQPIRLISIFASSKATSNRSMLKRFLLDLTLRQLTLLALALCIPAFLIHLGSMAFIGDEAIRTLVALEMKLSGNFLVPTLNGEEYFNKPPLYNWCIYMVSRVAGYFGEWPTRLTTLIFLGLFAWTVYYFIRKKFDQLTSITMALMLLTCGRILFWDSMLGLIDICFSWIIYLNFMILYFLARKEQWQRLFILSYLLFSIAFLLKGLPAVVFQGISILTALRLHGVLKQKLFSVPHFTGIVVGIIPLAAYYILYASQVSLDHVFSILVDQSMQRTATHHGIWKTITHIFTFPFEQSYHFLPWSLLMIMLFHPKFKTWMQGDHFIRYSFWMLLLNLPVYWMSVQVYPRYLLMFVPLFNLIGYYVLQQSAITSTRWWKILQYIFIVMTGLAMIMMILMPLESRVRALEGMIFIWLGGSVLITLCFFGMLWDVKRTFVWFAIALLVIRSVFDLVVIPLRKTDFPENTCRADCLRVASRHGHHTWYIYKETETHQVARFYTSVYSKQIIRRAEIASDTSAYYLVDKALYPDFPGTRVDSVILERGQMLALMRPYR